MNGARLLLSLALVALPAAALPAVRRTRRPREWAFILTASLGAGFVLVEASLIHAALPLGFSLLGLDRLAEVCRAMGGHLFGAAPPFSAFAGLLAIVIGVQAIRGALLTVRANSELRQDAERESSTPIAGYRSVVLPSGDRWAVAIPGGNPQVVLSSTLVGTLERKELDAVMRHEMAHLEHHHVRFLLLGAAVNSGLWFLPWRRRANTSLRLALERWADEASARSEEARANVRSAVNKLASLAPSALASYRIKALERSEQDQAAGREWAWSTAASATVPLVLALTVTLVLHLSQLIEIAG